MDPITLGIFRNALQSVAEEMGAALLRTAFSPNIKEQRNCSTAIFTTEGKLVAQAGHTPLHLGVMPIVLKSVIRQYPLDKLHPGDAIIINDPHLSGSHLSDVCVISPVYFTRRPLALVANMAHHTDVGGLVLGSMPTTSTEVFQDGLRIPPIKLRSQGSVNEETLRLITHNVRTGKDFYGNINAQLTANDVGEKRILELAQRYGGAKFENYMQEIMNYAERLMRSALAGIPAGSYQFEDYLEGDGITEGMINISVRVTCRGDSITIDFTGTHPQVPGPVNATRSVTLACVYYAIKAVVDPELPSSEGLFRPIEVIMPEGTLVNPRFPAPVAQANINTAQRIIDVLMGALAGAVPKRVTAAGTGSMNSFTIGGFNPNNESYYSYMETHGGGQGALQDQDGMDGIHINMTNIRNIPVEVIEITYPLRVERYGLLPDSGGPGKQRGGLGIVREITVLHHPATVSLCTERIRIKPWGLNGGLPGKSAKASISGQECFHNIKNICNKNICLEGKFTTSVPAGSTVILETAGGGGFGSPLDRDPELVRHDVLEGLVSIQSARDYYGVVFHETALNGLDIKVDKNATSALRAQLRKESH